MYSVKNSNIFRALLGYFLKGILLGVPLAATIYIISAVFVSIDEILPFDIPGLGILVLLLLLTVIGFLGSSFIAEPIYAYFNKLLNKAPLVKTIYSSIKDLLSAFVGQKKSFSEPVLVQLDENGVLGRVGFVTERDLSSLGLPEEKIAVYLPHSYAFSGNIFVVSANMVTPLKGNSSDIMKFVVSGGVSEVGGTKDEVKVL
jgi:uncharacterized membrane protein